MPAFVVQNNVPPRSQKLRFHVPYRSVHVADAEPEYRPCIVEINV